MNDSIAIYTITSALHNPQAVASVTQAFLSPLNLEFDLKGDNFSDYGTHSLDLIYVCTGGTEGVFKSLLPQLVGKSRKPFYLLASDKSNSLAASMEILSFLRQRGLQGEIIHGDAHYVSARIGLLNRVGKAMSRLCQCRLGVIGKPSDWLISSEADANAVRTKLGVELVDIPMGELLEVLKNTPEQKVAEKSDLPEIRKALPMACRIYAALKSVVQNHDLKGFTIRCFDLLDSVCNTGCWALAKLNAEGCVAGCEGDVPAMLSMTIVRALLDVSCFQANPSSINPETGEILFAHCTIPLDMVGRYELDTHYESGIGVGIRGFVERGPVTVFKVSGDLSRWFVAEGELVGNRTEANLCRTQLVVRLNDKSQTSCFLTNPIGNHHIIVLGHHADTFAAFMRAVDID